MGATYRGDLEWMMESQDKAIDYQNKRIAELEAEVERLKITRDEPEFIETLTEATGRIRELEYALREIAEHPHCKSTDEWDTAHAGGHRCAAEIARKALEGEHGR